MRFITLSMIALFFMACQAQENKPVISSLTFIYDSIFRVSQKKGTENINVKYDTVKVDSSMHCEDDTCYWTYTTRINSKYDTIRSGDSTTFNVKLTFTLFEPTNDSCQISGSVFHSYFGIDNQLFNTIFWGDTLTKPGEQKTIFCNFTVDNSQTENYSHNINFRLTAEQIHSGSISNPAQCGVNAAILRGTSITAIRPVVSKFKDKVNQLVYFQGKYLHIKADTRNELEQILIVNYIGKVLLRFNRLSSEEIILPHSTFPKGKYIISSTNSSIKWYSNITK